MSPATLGCVATAWVWTVVCANDAINSKHRVLGFTLLLIANFIAAFALSVVMR